MPVARAEIVAEVPVLVIAPGLIVQLPAGKPLRITLPVASAHAGWVIVPTTGAVGVAGCGLMTMFAVAVETHPAAFVTV